MLIIQSRITILTIILFAVMTFISIRARAQEETVDAIEEPVQGPPTTEPKEKDVPQTETSQPSTSQKEPVVNDDPSVLVTGTTQKETTPISPTAKKKEQTPESGLLTQEEIQLLVLPDEVDAKEGYAPPTGYEEVIKPRSGLIAGGTTLFACSYLKMIMVAGMSEEGTLAVPVIGPFLAMDGMEEILPLFIIDVAAQGAGLIMAIVGASTKQKKWVRKKPEQTSFHIAPTVLGKNSAGLGLSGTF